jgi:hypothetical protein
MTKLIPVYLVLLAVLFSTGCANQQNNASDQQETGSGKKKKHQEESIPANEPSSAGCDSSKWHYVYDPDRLEVLDPCKVVTGVITERNADPDGDEHMLLKLDKGQDNLLRKRNYSKKDGCLVIEAVCINNITRKRAMGACKGYANNVFLPKVGDHVRVTGTYVIDSHNGWTEIHPISKVEPVK